MKLILKKNINKYFFNKTKSRKIKKSENIQYFKNVKNSNNTIILNDKELRIKYLKSPPKLFKFNWFNLNYYYPEIKKIKIEK
tara:strand:- start:2182 stop:2427 length:246 start_codon:yes stop_codon:yes gene_type:complete